MATRRRFWRSGTKRRRVIEHCGRKSACTEGPGNRRKAGVCSSGFQPRFAVELKQEGKVTEARAIQPAPGRAAALKQVSHEDTKARRKSRRGIRGSALDQLTGQPANQPTRVGSLRRTRAYRHRLHRLAQIAGRAASTHARQMREGEVTTEHS